MTTARSRDIATLERRLIHLEERLQAGERDRRDLSYDRAERAALRRALEDMRQAQERSET